MSHLIPTLPHDDVAAWGKHTPAHYRGRHTTARAHDVPIQHVLPIVTIRHPFTWMQSMCSNPYSAKWKHVSRCPNLQINARLRDPTADTNDDDLIRRSTTSNATKANDDNDNDKLNRNNDETSNRARRTSMVQWNPVSVKYGAGIKNYTSLIHLWRDWYDDYYNHRPGRRRQQDTSFDAALVVDDDIFVIQSNHSFPFLLVRMEDLVIHTKDTITSICHCAGGQIRSTDRGSFIYDMIDSIKMKSKGHKTNTGIVEAWIKMIDHIKEPLGGLGYADYDAAKQLLEQTNWMQMLHYRLPPPR